MKEIKLMGFGEPDENGEQRAKSQNTNSPSVNQGNKEPVQSDVKKRTIDISIDPINSKKNQATNSIKQANARMKQGNNISQINNIKHVNTQKNQVNSQQNQLNSGATRTKQSSTNANQGQPNIRRVPTNGNQNITKTARRQPPTRDEVRQANGKIHKRRRKKNYILYYILLSFLLTVVVVSLSLTVLFNLSEITVKDYPGINKEKIIASSAIQIGDNLVRMNVEKIEAKILNENIMLDSVSVKRKFPSNVEISLVLSEPKIGIKNGSEYHYFSAKGRYFTSDTQRKGLIFQGVDVSKIKLGEYLSKASVDGRETMESLHKAIIESKIPNITYVDMRDISSIKLYYKDEIEIIIGSMSLIQYKLDKAKELIANNMEEGVIGQLDVQVYRKGFFRPIDFVTPW